MIPLLIAAGVAAASAYSQWRNSQDAQKLSKAQLEKVDAMFSKMQTPAFDENGTPSPQYDVTKLTPQDYSVLKQYVPEAAAYVKEANPTLINETDDTRAGRQAQRDALTKLRDISANNGQDPAMAAKLQMANESANQNAQRQQQSILQDENRRGLLGSGMALQAKLSGGADAMSRSADQGNQAAIEAYKNQLSALRDSASLGGQMRGQDLDMQAKNADIINAYNTRGARSQQDYNNQRAGMMNEAQRYNIGQSQDAANRNTSQNNQYAVMNRSRDDAMVQEKANWAQKQREYLNGLRQNTFADQMNINSGKSGAFQGMAANAIQSAQDRNSAVAGASNAATSGAMYYDGQNRADARYDQRYGKKPADDEEDTYDE